jgi:hypothetical protein
LKTNLNSKKLTAVRVSDVLNDQERHHEKKQPSAVRACAMWRPRPPIAATSR